MCVHDIDCEPPVDIMHMLSQGRQVQSEDTREKSLTIEGGIQGARSD